LLYPLHYLRNNIITYNKYNTITNTTIKRDKTALMDPVEKTQKIIHNLYDGNIAVYKLEALTYKA